MGTQSNPIMAATAGTLVMLVLGSIYTFGALTPYLSSYLFYHGDPTSNTALSILFTAALVCTNIGQVLSSFLSAKMSNRTQVIISILMISSSVFSVSFVTTFFGYVILYGILFGMAIGIGYVAPIKNCYQHLPQKKGLMAGICMSGFGISSVMFNQILVLAVNPQDVPVDHETKHFPRDVADNLPFALRILAGCFFLLGMGAAIFIRPPKNRDTIFSQTMLSENSSQNEMMESNGKSRGNRNLKAVCQKKAYFLTIQLACMIPFGVFIASNYKNVAFQFNSDFETQDHLITLLGSIGILCNGVFRCMWGFLLDKFSFKVLSSIINIILLVCCCMLFIAIKTYITYLILVVLVYLSYGGMYALMPTQSVKVLGQQIGTKMYWVVFSGFSIAAIIQFTIRFILIDFMQVENGYVYCIIIFGVLSFLGLIINCFVNYNYQDQQNRRNREKGSTNDSI